MTSVRKNRWWRSLFSRTAPIKKQQTLNYRPSFMGLEERITPAFNTLISLNPTVGMSIVTAAGTTTYTATAAGANVSSLDISTQLNSGFNVVIDTGSTGTQAGNITAPSIISVSYNNAANATLTFQSGSGTGLVGNITLPNITLTAPGSILVRANQDFIGDGLNAQSLDIRAANGSITSTNTLEGTDLFLRSGTGIGTLGTPLQTKVTNLTAKTTTNGGGIFITEADDLSLANVNGVNGIEANNGQIVLQTTDGSLNTNNRIIFSGVASISISVGGLDSTFNNSSGLLQTFDKPISITADRMVLGSLANGIFPGASTVTLNPFSANRPVNLGSAADPTGSLNLSSAELGTIGATTTILTIGRATAGTITISAAITFASDLSLLTGAGITGSGDFINGSASAVALTMDQAGTSTYSGRIGGPSGGTAAQKNIALTKLGTGILKLSGNNTYTGTTTVTAGTLIVNGTSGAGDTTVQTGATIGGSGTIGVNNITDLIVQSGGTLSPGDGGIGSLTVGNKLTLNTGSTFLVDIGPGSSADQVNTKSVTVNQDALLTGLSTLPVNSSAFTLISIAGGLFTIGGTGFKDVNGTAMPVLSGGPIVVGNQPFNYAYSGSGFKLTAVSTIVSVDGSGNMLVSDTLGQSDNWTLSRNGANIRVTDPTNTIFAGPGAIQVDAHTVDVPFNTVTGKLLLNSNTGNDTVVLNLANGLLPAGGLNFDGGSSGSNDLTVNGTNGNDQLIYRANSCVPANTEFSLNGGSFNNSLTGVSHFSFNGLGGVDTMTVDYVNGDPVASGGIDFDGGTGINDTLVVTSPLAAGRSGNYQPSGTTPGSGTVDVDADQIRFTNLTPVDVSGMVNFTVLLPNSNDTVDITGGPSFSDPMQPALIFSGNSNAVPFESLSVWNVTNLKLDTTTVDGTDAITLSNTGLASNHLVTNLTLTTGASADTVGVSGAVNLGGSLTFDLGTGANVLTFTTATVNAPAGISQTGAGSNVLAGGLTSLNTTTGNINLANNINGTVANTQSLSMSTTAGDMVVTSIGNTTALNSLTAITTSGTIRLNGSTYHAGTQTYTGPVVLTSASVLFDGTTLNGPITFNNTLTGTTSDVTVTTSGDTSFNNAVNVHSLLTNGGGTTNSNAGTITTVTTQFYDDNVRLGSTTTFASTGGSTITFNGTVNGSGAATINTTGDTVFNGTIGNGTALASLTTNVGGTTFINNSPLVITVGAQSYGDAVRIGVDTNFQSTANANITFSNTLDSKAGLNVAATVTTTGTTTFGGAVGSLDALSALTTNAGGTTNINGGSVKTTGNQTFGDAVVIAINTTFTSTGAGAISFNSILDSIVGTPRSAIVTTAGPTTFGAAVGGNAGDSKELLSLTTNGGNITNINGGSIRTTTFQTYTDAVVLGANTTFTSTSSGAILFSSTLDSTVGTPFSAIVRTAGVTTFAGAVGGNAGDNKELLSLTTNGGGTTNINGGSVRTTTFQLYDDAVALGINTTLTSTLGGTITFGSTLNGPGGLLSSTTGTTVFNDVVGGSSPLAYLTTGPAAINTSSITTSGAQSFGNTTLSVSCTFTTTNSNLTFNGSVTTITGSNITFALGSGDLVFTGTVSNVGDLRINSAQNVTINGLMTVSSFVQITGTGTTRFNGNTNLVHVATAGTSKVDITTNKIELNANLDAGLFDMRFNPVAGANQISGAITSGLLRLAGGGTFTLNGLANNCQTNFGANLTTAGTISLRTANSLVVDPVGGIRTFNSDVTLFAGKNFEAVNPAVTLIDLGGILGGVFNVTPGETTDSNSNFNTKISAQTANFGNPILGTGNINRDSFNIRPSESTPIYVWGNLPQTLPGDSLNANLSDLDPGETVNFVVTTPPNQVNKSGYYQFANGTRQTLYFNDIETIANNFSVSEVLSYQTLIGQYSLRFLANIDGFKLGSILPQFSVPENQFVVAPRYVNPNAPFSAPRIALSDVNGDGFADVIVGNGSNKAPLVSIIDGKSIADNVYFPTPIKLLTQFYAYEPNFVGGVFLAAGDVTGDGKNDVVVGSDSGRNSQVRIFSYNTGTQQMDLLSTLNMPTSFGTKGVRVAVGSVQGLTTQNIVVGSGPGVQNRVLVLDTTPAHSVLRNFSPYPATFKGGVFVAVGKYDGDNKADVLIGPGAGAMPDKKAPRIFVLSGAQLSLGLPPSPPAVPTTNSWYLFNQYAQFTIAPTGIQPVSWINAQGVSSVSFARTTPGPLTIVVGAARGLGTQLVRYTSAAGAYQDYFIESVFSTDALFSYNLYKNYRDGAAIATLV